MADNRSVSIEELVVKEEPLDIKEEADALDDVAIKKELQEEDIPSLEATSLGKQESVDAEDVDSASAVKRELDIGPTVLQPVDMQFMQRPCKPEPVEEQAAGTSQRDSWSEAEWSVDRSACTQSRALLICNKRSALRADLDHHITPNAGEEYHCEHCLVSFTLKSRLELHMKTHFGRKLHRNNSINELKWKLKYEQIVTNNTGEKRHICRVCHKAYRSSSHLKVHIMTHTGEKSHKRHICRVCCKAFFSPSHLKSHILTHTGDKPHNCIICKRAFTRKTYLKKHLMTHNMEMNDTGVKSALLQPCTICNKMLHPSGMKHHMMTHTGEKPHSCKICGRNFLQSVVLKKHMMIHSGVKPYPCDICKKSSRCPSELKIHMMTHTGGKPHHCNVCNKDFKTPSEVKIHEFTHNMEKTSHPCTICEKSFISKNALKVHVMSHTRENPHDCDICGKGFMFPSQLKTHMRTHKEGKSLLS